MKTDKPKTNIFLLYFVRFMIFIIFLETLLRIVSNNETQTEKYNGEYQYFFENRGKTWFHTWEANSSNYYGNSEFQKINHYNDLGHREKPFTSFKNDTTSVKVVCLGDSFTEGDGATYDSTWVRFLETQLSLKNNTAYNFYNAGVCGSDIFYNYIILKEKLMSAKPSYVIECLNNSDLRDVYYRGGLNRFNENGTLNSPNFKKWEIFFKYSHVVRLFVSVFTPYNEDLVKRKEELNTNTLIAAQIKKTKELCDENNIKYLLVIMPTAYEIKDKDSEFDFENFHLLLDKNINYINIFDCMKNKFPNQEVNDYYWLNDGHYNGKGYFEMGKCIFEEIEI